MEIKQKKGISLIVLVITIIVMIILAAAIILSLNSSGIIGKANQATTESNTANKKEAASIALAEYELKKQLGELAEGETATSYVQKALDDQGIDGSDVAVTADNEILVGLSESAVEAVKANIPVGATVTGYTLTQKSYETDGSEHTGTILEFDDETGEIVGEIVVTGEAQTLITNTALTWKYIGIDEEGNMLIAADMPSTVPAASKIELGYQGGYLYGPDMLNTVCDALYTTNKGKARSMNIDDVNNLLQYTGSKGSYWDTRSNEIITEEALTIGEISTILGNIQFSNVKTPDGTNTWEALSKYKSDYYYILETSEDIKNAAGKELVYYSTEYWLASNCTHAHFDNECVNFYIRCVGSGSVLYYDTCTSSGDATYDECVIRPVVELNSNITFNYDNTTNICTLN